MRWTVGLLVLSACSGDISKDSTPSPDTECPTPATWFTDSDGDGYGNPEAPVSACDAPPGTVADGTDCDDSDAAVHPGAVWYEDTDGDGYGSGDTADACFAPDGYVANGGDCDETNPAINPGALELCDDADIDENCNGLTDSDDPALSEALTWYQDMDGDGYGETKEDIISCEQPEGYVLYPEDCDDYDSRYHPGADESDCSDPNDYNCDGSVGYTDSDGDGFAACEECDDQNDAISPDATESCNLLDDDCDGTIDEGDAIDASTWYLDADGDGYGDPSQPVSSCGYEAGISANRDDCDDSRADVNPAATEVCDADGLDEDCDGLANGDDPGATGTVEWYLDADSDGYGDSSSTASACERPAGYVADSGDCDDTNPSIYPGATDACDELDNDCDGAIDEDEAAGVWYADADADGFGDPATALTGCEAPPTYTTDATDCDDTDPSIYPGAADVCDTRDNDCDGDIDEDASVSTWYADADADGFGDPATALTGCEAPANYSATGDDCDDTNPAINPAATELCDPLDADEDCDGLTDDADPDATGTGAWFTDDDGDGFGDTSGAGCEPPVTAVDRGDDCDDADPAIYPGAVELCDGYDNDCDGSIDVGATDVQPWYADADGDSFGDPSVMVESCTSPANYVSDDTDCDDTNTAISPAAAEVCDDLDNDCDGLTDDADPGVSGQQTGYSDADTDGFGDPATLTTACDLPPNGVLIGDDCDDTNPAINPAATEVCDDADADEDCDGLADNADTSATGTLAWHPDADTDGFGDVSAVFACDPVGSEVLDDTDCDDTNAAVYPGATEVCDGLDNDCNASIDDGATDASTWYADADADGFGDPATAVTDCTAPASYLGDNTDCDDTNPTVFPGGAEVCDGLDNNCNGAVDEDAGDAPTWYTDADNDSFGDPATAINDCAAPAGTVSDSADCDDTDAAINPAATEVCDPADTDEDCDSLADDADTSAVGGTTWNTDADGDGYGDAATTATRCDPVGDEVEDNTDCDDTDADINPGGTEVCDGGDDEDCDGLIDGADPTVSGAETWYADADADGYGDATITISDCAAPSGYVDDGSDCDDADGSINPGEAEVCDSDDNDCDGLIDEADPDYEGGTTWYRDADSDGFGTTSVSLTACSRPDGFVSVSTDCDDGDAAIHPNAAEVCDGDDNDCDSLVDDDDADVSGQQEWYRDTDGDGYGTSITISRCDAPTGYADTAGDCNDILSSVNPGEAEVCSDGLDNDCDGLPGAGCGPSGDIDLSEAVKLIGEAGSDAAGTALGGAGDVNGDGYDDLLIGAPQADRGATNAGAAYILFGPVTTDTDLSAADAILYGTNASNYAGGAVTGIGDLDNDGFGEVLVGSYGVDYGGSDAGMAYLLYGPLSGTASLSTSTAKIYGEDAADYATQGTALGGIGDQNGDGTGDLYIGAYGDDDGGAAAGAVYVVSGTTTGLRELSTNIAKLRGEGAADYAGWAVSSAGDMNGDGTLDLAVGAYGLDSGTKSANGAVYVLYGPISGTMGLSAADLKYLGEDSSDNAGFAVAGGGDTNADGYDDLVVGAYKDDDGGTDAGAAYLLLGPSASGNLSRANGKLIGEVANDYAGVSVAIAGDVDVDGTADVLVGAVQQGSGGASAGAAYLMYGPFSGTIDLSAADATLIGETAFNYAGIVGSAGDTNGDGSDDLLIGAPYESSGGIGAGAGYLLVGGGF